MPKIQAKAKPTPTIVSKFPPQPVHSSYLFAFGPRITLNANGAALPYQRPFADCFRSAPSAHLRSDNGGSQPCAISPGAWASVGHRFLLLRDAFAARSDPLRVTPACASASSIEIASILKTSASRVGARSKREYDDQTEETDKSTEGKGI